MIRVVVFMLGLSREVQLRGSDAVFAEYKVD